MYSPDSRLQDAGLIRSQDFDTVFMGTSLAIHFRQSDIDRILGVHSLKLSMTGSNSHEQISCWRALERHPRRVMWQTGRLDFPRCAGIDSEFFCRPISTVGMSRALRAICSAAPWRASSAWILARSIPPIEPLVARLTNGVIFNFPIARVDDINVLRSDFDVSRHLYAKKAMAAFRHITDPGTQRYLADGADYDAMVRNFERDTAGLVAKNPDVTFDIFFPPYSILEWVAMRDASPGTLEVGLRVHRLCHPAADVVSERHPVRFPRGQGHHP